MFEEIRCQINQQEKRSISEYFLMANFPNLENKIKQTKKKLNLYHSFSVNSTVPWGTKLLLLASNTTLIFSFSHDFVTSPPQDNRILQSRLLKTCSSRKYLLSTFCGSGLTLYKETWTREEGETNAYETSILEKPVMFVHF